MHNKDSIGAKLKRIQQAYPNLNEATGQLWAHPGDKRRKPKTVTMWGIFVSDENTFLVRPHVFDKTARTPAQWNDWFSEYYGEILRNRILPSMANRTGKEWRLYRIIGWTAGDSKRSIRTASSKKRNKTKPRGGSHGRNSTRR